MSEAVKPCRNPDCTNVVPLVVVISKDLTSQDTYYSVGVCSELCYQALTPGNLKEYMNNKDNESQGLRHNTDKERVSLIPPEIILALAMHFTVGAKKYEDNNWRKGLSYNETYDCLQRHALKWAAGERDDPETGSHHMTAVIWNAVALLYFETYPFRYGKFDDRYKHRIENILAQEQASPYQGLYIYDAEIPKLERMLQGWTGTDAKLDLHKMIIELRQHTARDERNKKETT